MHHRNVCFLSIIVFTCLQIDRYLRKLDQELSKFKMELEADNAGITELLERSKFCCTVIFWKYGCCITVNCKVQKGTV